jgi:hypothetical protein
VTACRQHREQTQQQRLRHQLLERLVHQGEQAITMTCYVQSPKLEDLPALLNEARVESNDVLQSTKDALKKPRQHL